MAVNRNSYRQKQADSRRNNLIIGASVLLALVFTVLMVFAGKNAKKDSKTPAPPVDSSVPPISDAVNIPQTPLPTNPPSAENGDLPSIPPIDLTSGSIIDSETPNPSEEEPPADSNVASKVGAVFAARLVEWIRAQEPPRLSFVACGDNLIHSSIYTDAQTLAAGTGKNYNFLPMYENVADVIRDADIAFINQETPFGGTSRPISGYPLFNSPDEVGYDLIELGFDVINLANNHMLDSTAAGYQRTIEFWEEQPNVLAIGGYKNKEDYENIRIMEKDGIKIAFLSYTYGTNGLSLPRDSSLVVPLCTDAEIDRQTKLARGLADCVIVSVHWGVEDSFTPSAEQRRQAQLMVDNGVDVIIGHHPHVLQPMKWVDRPDGGRTLIMYSLGNFLSGMMYSRNMVGGMMGFDIVKADTGVVIENAYFIPTVCQYNSSVRGFKLYRFADYTEELQKAHGAHKFDAGMSMKSMQKIVKDAIPSEFLTQDANFWDTVFTGE